MSRRLALWLLTAVGAAVLACVGAFTLMLANAPQFPRQACFPPQSGLADAPAAVADQPVHGLSFPIDLYFDASESMAGYVRGGEAGDVRPLQDLVSLTVGPSAALGGHVRTLFFGAAIHPVAPDALSRLATVDAYVCAHTDPDCDNMETHLDAVLNAIAAAPTDRLSVIVTDLWLSNNELISSREVALGVPIRRIFAGGRSVEVMGVQSPYVGPIYDIPGVPQAPAWTKDRPLFLVIVGPLDKADLFRRLLVDLQTPSFAAVHVHTAVFTTEQPPAASVPTLSGAASSSAMRPASVLDPHYRLNAQQFDVRPADALRLAAGQAAYSATIRASDSIPTDWAWRGPLVGKARIWMLTSPDQLARCTADGALAWRDAGDFPGAWTVAGADQAGALTIDPASPAIAHLAPGRDYLIVAQLLRGPMQHPSPATQWMRDWSFEDADGPRLVAASPQVFPTYKLAETAALLETGLESAQDGAARPLLSLPVLIRVTR
jgi:hypothetical protein